MQPGIIIPENIVFQTRVRDDNIPGPNPYTWKRMTSGDYFNQKRVVMFSLPGAFTPTCSTRQLPSYEDCYNDFMLEEIDDVYCVSVNDAFVMNAWARQLDIKDVKMIPDGNGELTKALGMLVNKQHLGFGWRSWRYAAVVDDGIVEQVFIEPGINNHGLDNDPYLETKPEIVLNYLQSERILCREHS